MLADMDDQLLEIFGRHRLIESLLKAGLEVAIPARDRGVDLIAYSDTDVRLGRFVGIPIQMKAASKACFSIDKKYSKFHDMLVARSCSYFSVCPQYLRICRVSHLLHAKQCRADLDS
jgi:hypothetical protein